MGCLYLYHYLTKKQVCVQPTVNSAVEICCCASCCGAAAAGRQAPAAVNRYVPACRTLSSKPAARRSGCRTMGQTDGRTDARPLRRPCCAYYAARCRNSRDALYFAHLYCICRSPRGKMSLAFARPVFTRWRSL